jgi:hypothetical protein
LQENYQLYPSDCVEGKRYCEEDECEEVGEVIGADKTVFASILLQENF